LRRKPWSSSHDSSAGGGLGAVPQQQGEQQARQQLAGQPTGQQQAGQQQHHHQLSAHHPHDPELEAAAEAVLADRGCWLQDSARLAAEADIIAGELAEAGRMM